MLPPPQMSLFQVLLDKTLNGAWLGLGTVEALLILKMTTTILIIRKDMIFAKNSKDGRDHHHSSDHTRDYCRDHSSYYSINGGKVDLIL